ncbi:MULTISPECIES: LacI family DNA-binding transcriptional regulator [Atopobiaceae]|uniref:LacI family DNA-binding transcriptional regulator n=1 Tax=Atopobiaceae TaxID=1643824 RepID=UPI00034E3014|nr:MULTISPECIES: LacI family DNA-binding transcriptional regulator [Atopobiaceae]EPD78541.1 LacI family transcriptional regulator, sucrose operon repressor [Atopobium sp. oral taxon 199 str. F0494]
MNITTVAKLAGVSRATVSRYLNDGYVSDEKRRAIARVIKETGYIPSRQAKILRTGKTHLIGVIIPKINSASVSRMVAGLSSVFNDSQYQMLLANTDNHEKEEIDYLRVFTEKDRVDGIILVGTILTPEHERVLKDLRIPLVVLGQEFDGFSCVYHDDYHALYDITSHALKYGSRPAYIGVTERDIAAGKSRHMGFTHACDAKKIKVPERAQIESDFSVDSAYLACETLLDVYPEVDTIVCASDAIAFGAMTCLREFGRNVPEDVQVTGVGDSDLSKVITPSLTTIHHHYKTSGMEAAKMLIGAMDNEDNIVREIRMGYELLVRNSTRSDAQA